MKKIVITLLLIVASVTTQAQENLTWHTDLAKATEISNKEQKPLFLFFTGSDWCGWCIRLQKEVFKTPEFESWAKVKVVLVELDFPRRTPQPEAIKIQNSQMQQIFAVRGYPSGYFVKPTMVDGKTNYEQLGNQGYVAGGPSKWLEGANAMISKYIPSAKPVSAVKSKAKKKKALKKS